MTYNFRTLIRAGKDSMGNSTPKPKRSDGLNEGNGPNNSISKKYTKVAAYVKTIDRAKFLPGHYTISSLAKKKIGGEYHRFASTERQVTHSSQFTSLIKQHFPRQLLDIFSIFIFLMLNFQESIWFEFQWFFVNFFISMDNSHWNP